MSGYVLAGAVLLWLLVVLLIIGAVRWASRSEPQPLPQPARDSDYESTLTSPPPDVAAGPQVTLPAARVWKDMPPGWVNTIPSAPMPLDPPPQINGSTR